MESDSVKNLRLAFEMASPSGSDTPLIIGVLVFGYIGDIIAWIFTFSKTAIVWNVMYLVLLIIRTVGLAIDESMLLIAPIIAFLLDILIAIGGLSLIITGQDIELITGKNSLGRKLYRTDTDNETIMMQKNKKGAKILGFLFVFYIFTQPTAAGLLINVLL